jgi:hypothetical protein
MSATRTTIRRSDKSLLIRAVAAAGATTVEIDASHVSMISHPDGATELIEKAAKATQ